MSDEQAARMKRAQERKNNIVAHRVANHEEAEEWDLTFWQAQTPQDRLSALVDIQADVEKVEQARRYHEQHPRHQEDARVLRQVLEMKSKKQ